MLCFHIGSSLSPVSLPCSSPVLDHDVTQLQRLPYIVQNRKYFILVSRPDKIGLGKHSDRALSLRVHILSSLQDVNRGDILRFSIVKEAERRTGGGGVKGEIKHCNLLLNIPTQSVFRPTYCSSACTGCPHSSSFTFRQLFTTPQKFLLYTRCLYHIYVKIRVANTCLL